MSHDTSLLDLMAFKLRVVTACQMSAERHLLRKLAGDGLLCVQSLPVRLLPAARFPLYSTDAPTDLSEVVSVARSRFSGLDMRNLKIYSLAQKGANYFGLKARRIRLPEVEHDLALAGIFLSLSAEDQQKWQKEDVFEDRTGVVPDAWLGEEAHEFVGSSYRLEKVQRFVETLEGRGVKVVLW